jgi:hypothetical protein
MKLQELLTNTFGENVSYPNDQLGKLKLEPLKEELLKCDEFSECEGIEFMEFPVQLIEGKSYSAQTMKLGDNTKFDGKVFLYNLSFTPEMFDPNSLHTPVKNGALITPALYNPITFEPTKKIVLTFSPEMVQDVSGANDELTLRNDIHKLLDDVLDNPEEYKVKGERGIMVRGVFKTKNVDRKQPPYLTGTPMEPNSYMAYYMEKTLDQTPNQLSLTLKSKPIPKHLKDEFIKRFTDNGGIATATTEEIENFIKEKTMERDTSWDDPQLSDGDMPIRQQNAFKNTFPDIEIQKEVEPQSQLDELNDYLKMLSDMDKIGIRRKIVLLEGYIHKLKNGIK